MVYLPLWKIWKSVGIMKFPTEWKQTVPNHQPGIVFNNINTKYLLITTNYSIIYSIYYLGKLLILWYFTNLNCWAIWGWFPLLTMIPVRENSEVVIIYPDTVYIYIHMYTCTYIYRYIYININHLYILLLYILISIRWNRHQAWTDDHPC